MKFKYTGQLPIKSADLVLKEIFKPSDVIRNGTEFDVPDEEGVLIQRLKVAGYYEECGNTVSNFYSTNNEEEEEEEEEED